jgi:hypothetical protein
MFGMFTLRSFVPREPENVRDPILTRNTLGGEGGYGWNTQNYVFYDKIFVSQAWRNSYFPGIFGSTTTNYDYRRTIEGTEYAGLSGAIRISAGSSSSGMLRDGRVFYNGSDKGINTWLQNNWRSLKDIFTPCFGNSVMALLSSGEFYDWTISTANSTPVVFSGTDTTVVPNVVKNLTDVDRIVAITQAHACDCLVGCKDDSVWHVKYPSDGGAGSPAIKKMANVRYSEIAFAQLGDYHDLSYLVKIGKPRELWRISRADRATTISTTITQVNPHAFPVNGSTTVDLLQDEDEEFVDGVSNEFHATFLTNKRVLVFRTSSNSSGYYPQGVAFKQFVLTEAQKPPVRMCTAAAYSMAVELADGIYLLSNNGLANYESGASNSGEYYNAYSKMERVSSWSALQTHLDLNREDYTPAS